MRIFRNVVIAIVTTAVFTTGLGLIGTLATARGFGGGGPDTQQLIREGQVVEINDTTITIHEWAGKYTYRLSPAGRQSLLANQIQPGDRVQFHVWAVWEVAYYFRKI